jgi:hypothetical protein
MPRVPRRSTDPRGRGGAVGALTATLARRREARAPRVIVRDETGQPRALDVAHDPSATTLLALTDALISAAQRDSGF